MRIFLDAAALQKAPGYEEPILVDFLEPELPQ
jgi:hypothetical protein